MTIKIAAFGLILTFLATGVMLANINTDRYSDTPVYRSSVWWPYDISPPYNSVGDSCKPNVIRLAVGEFDTQIGEFSVPDALKAIPLLKEDSGIFIVQFQGPVTESDKTRIKECGIDILEYIPNHAFAVRMTSEMEKNVKKIAAVRWIGRFHPAYKIDPMIGHIPFKSLDRLEDPEYQLVVSSFSGSGTDDITKLVNNLGGSVLEYVRSSVRHCLIVKILPEFIPVIAQIEDVRWIEEVKEHYQLNDETQEVLQSGSVAGGTPIWNQGIHGENQIIGHLDSGVDADHCFYYDSTQPLPTSTVNLGHRKIIAYRTYADGVAYDGCSNGHGTHTAGTVAGYTDNASGSAYIGLAYEAKLTVGDVGQDDFLTCLLGLLSVPASLTGIYSDAMGDGAFIHTNSWGSTDNTYDSFCTDTDGFMWENKNFLILYAAGNSGPNAGSVGSPATSKNILCVGGSNNEPIQDQIWDSSSRGPVATSNRMAPMIMAPATDGTGYLAGIDSAASDGAVTGETCTIIGQGYQGTSMACPAAAACTTLVRQYYSDGYYPTGSPVAGNQVTPSAALLKATIINSAHDMSGVSHRPNNDQGWGRILLDDVLYFPGDSAKLFVIDDMTGLMTNDTHTYPITVNSSTVPLKITLVWTDYQGNFLINDLDLTLTNGTTTYFGNNFSNGWSSDGNSPDRSIPTENIFLENGSYPTGNYSISIMGYTVPSGDDGYQAYALVVTGDIDTASSPTATPTGVPTNTPQPPSPTPEITGTPDCPHHGDVNLDGTHSAGDAQLAFMITLGQYTPTYLEDCAADCNGDGSVTAGDAQMIFYAALGSGSCSDPL